MKKVILFSFLGFMYSNTQFSIGLDILRQINNELTHDEGESINDIAPYMNDINLPSLTLGIEKIGHLGKKKRIDFGFEYSMNISRKYADTPYDIDGENISMSLINFYSKYRFLENDNINMFFKIGHSELINYNIAGINMATRSGLFSLGAGITYKNKLRISYDVFGFTAYDDYSDTSTDYYHDVIVNRINLAYLF